MCFLFKDVQSSTKVKFKTATLESMLLVLKLKFATSASCYPHLGLLNESKPLRHDCIQRWHRAVHTFGALDRLFWLVAMATELMRWWFSSLFSRKCIHCPILASCNSPDFVLDRTSLQMNIDQFCYFWLRVAMHDVSTSVLKTDT